MPAWRQTLNSLTEFRFFGETTILRRLALLEPKKRRGRVRWILFFAVVGVVSALMLDASVREWVMTHARPTIARVRATLTKAPPAAAPAPAASDEPATWPSVTVSANPPAASAVVEAKAADSAAATEPAPASASATASASASASASAPASAPPAPRRKPRRKSRR